MDFKQIEAFISVARLKSFSKAANKIFLSQPTISSHISSLEKELSIQLFDRTSKEVNLTPAGESFLEYAVDIINTRNNAVTTLSSFNNNISGILNLSASSTPCSSIVPNLMKEFSSLYPEVTFNITQHSSGDIIKNILELKCEIGLVGSTINDDKISTYKIMEDELVIISNPLLNVPENITLDELTKYDFILREKNSATRKTFEKAFNKSNSKGCKLNIVCEVNDLDALISFVRAGLGISIVSKQIYYNYMSDNSLKISTIEDISLKRNIYLIVNSRRTLTPTGRAFFNMCKEKYSLHNDSINN
jgi:DNA-binding transcriptional LysR family regulator